MCEIELYLYVLNGRVALLFFFGIILQRRMLYDGVYFSAVYIYVYAVFFILKLIGYYYYYCSYSQRASDQKTEMEKLKVKQSEESANLEKRKKEIETELSEIEPLVQKTKDAVGNIKSESLSEIRSLRIPPDVIRDILEGVLRLMGIFDVSWLSMRRWFLYRS